MRRLVSTMAVVCLFTWPAFAQTSLQLEASGDGRFVLPVNKGSELVHQCARAFPQGVDKFYMPADFDLDLLEEALPKFIAEQAQKPADATYERQYIGISIKGHDYIYGNFFPKEEANAQTPDRRMQPAVVCGGGPAYWGVVFDPGEGTFVNISFNQSGETGYKQAFGGFTDIAPSAGDDTVSAP